MDSKEPEEHSLVKRMVVRRRLSGGTKEREARKVVREVMKAFRKVVFALSHQKRVQAIISSRGRDQKGKGKEGAYLNLNQDIQPLKHPEKKDLAMSGNQTIGTPA